MSTEVQQDIVYRVKETLGITENINNSELYKILNHELSNSHPDRYTEEEIKKKAEEKFKQLNGLRKEFHIFLENDRLNHQLTPYEPKEVQTSIDTTTTITNLELEVLSMKKQLESKDWSIEYTNRQLKEAEEKYAGLISDTTELAKENITDIYKPKTTGTIIGIGSALGTLTILIPQVQSVLSSMGIGGIVASILVILLALFWVLRHVRNFLANTYIESLIDKIIVGTDLMEVLNVTIPDEKYPKPYFTEQDIAALVEHFMNKRYIRFLLFGSYNSIKRNIVEYLILELERKHFIIDVKSNDLVKKFYIEHNNNSTRNFTF